MKLRALTVSLVFAAAATVTAGTAAQQPASSSASPEPPLRMSPEELEIYKHARTLIDWTPDQIRSVPFLRNLHLAENQDKLPSVLNGVGKTAVALFRDFTNVDCDERVYSETNLKNPLASWGGMGLKNSVHDFRYIIIPRPLGDVLAFDEYRTDTKGKPVDITRLPGLMMITSDFASSWLYFSPADQHDSRFRYFGTQSLQKRECYVVGFAQNPEIARSVSGFRIGDQAAVLLVQGLAWIDPQSFHILRINTWLLAPRPDLGLQAENTVVDYAPVQPADSEKVLWLPHEVTVTTVYRNAFIRNTHRYSKFRLFRAETTIKPAE